MSQPDIETPPGFHVVEKNADLVDLRNAILDAIRPFEERVPSTQILALVAQMVGNIIGAGAQHTYAIAWGRQIATINLELGLSQSLEFIGNTQGSA